jgi:hypothetical protein
MDQLEQDVLEMILKGDDPVLATLRIQLGVARRKPRELSGVGFFTHFEVPETAPHLSADLAKIKLGDVTAEIEGLLHGAGFVLFVDDGALSMLEGYTYDEPWPSTIKSYTLSYMGKAGREALPWRRQA